MAVKPSSKKPSWWKPSLYDFIKADMDLSGWVWEFSRRSILKRILGNKPVGAMNPLPVRKFLLERGVVDSHGDPICDDQSKERLKDLQEMNLYFTYNDLLKYGIEADPWAVSSVTIHEPTWRRMCADTLTGSEEHLTDEQWMFASGKRSGLQVPIFVDLQSRDTVIKSDFPRLLTKLRAVYPQPQRTSNHHYEWIENRVLQVWDLREYKVKWSEILNLLFSGGRKITTYEDPIKLPRNAYDTAKSLINEDGWHLLSGSIRKQKKPPHMES